MMTTMLPNVIVTVTMLICPVRGVVSLPVVVVLVAVVFVVVVGVVLGGGAATVNEK